MTRKNDHYLWENPDWPHFQWDWSIVAQTLGSVRFQQGKLLGKVASLGFDLGNDAYAKVLIEDAIQTFAIEGQVLNRGFVRSSVAKRLGLVDSQKPTDQVADGIVEVLLDATINQHKLLTKKRLCGWHAALFPTGYSGIHKITLAGYRKTPIEVVSGLGDRSTVHFKGPPPDRVADEMARFLMWFRQSKNEEGLIRAGLAHLWFVTIHPFDDGNGRLARALTDMALAQDEKVQQRFYSLSTQINRDRKGYYDALEVSQGGGGDVTPWLMWFLGCLERSIANSDTLLGIVMIKSKFWEKHGKLTLNDRQRKVLNKMLDGFQGNLTNQKYRGMTKTSPATAIRDLMDMVQKGVLVQNPGGGRAISYQLFKEI